MAQPIYFLPGLRAADADDRANRSGILAARGLAEIFAGVPFDHQPCYEVKGNGPGDLAGCFLCYQTHAGGIPRAWGNRGMEELTWSAIGDGSLLWIGIDPKELPRPEELARAKKCRGYVVTLGDGQEWHVPVVRRPNGTSFLPSAFSRDSTGKRVEKLRAEYAAHFEAFRPVADWAYGGMDTALLDRDAFIDLAIRAIGINYRFAWNEQELLGLVGNDNYLDVVSSAVDWWAFDNTSEAQKKSSDPSDGVSSTPGPPADSTITPPASPTSSS